MFIVLIHWRIKNNANDIQAFKTHWREKLEILPEHRKNLIGEFLSDPLDSTRYSVDSEIAGKSGPVVSFFNVGIWKDEESFYQAIKAYLPASNGDLSSPNLLPFEAEARIRSPLDPVSWRRGDWSLPGHDSF